MDIMSHFRNCPPSRVIRPQRITAETIVGPSQTCLKSFDSILTRPVDVLPVIHLYQHLQFALHFHSAVSPFNSLTKTAVQL